MNAPQERQQITIADHLGDQLTPEQVRKIIAIFGFAKPREMRRSAQERKTA